jgi:hypothetical protein
MLPAILGFALTAAADDQPVPFKGHFDEAVTSATPEADGTHVTTAGQGEATHLGRFTSNDHAVIHADGTIQAAGVLTAANGDQLFWSYVLSFTSANTVAGTFTLTGGTGRFVDASGTGQFDGVIAPDGIHASVTFDGTIQF